MLCVLWLGSSVGNLKPHEAVGFFQSVQQSAGPNTQVRPHTNAKPPPHVITIMLCEACLCAHLCETFLGLSR